MHEVRIRPVWTLNRSDGDALSPRVVELLVRVHEHGSLARACEAAALSYRHAWQLLREGEALFGEPLLTMERGKGSRLTPLGEKLVWADRRIAARLSPLLDTLASELHAEIAKVLAAPPPRLRIHASHGFAVQALHGLLQQQGLAHELKYCGTAEALGSLNSGGCEVAGFHVPLGEHEAAAVAHYAAWFRPRSQRLIGVATRRQGLVVAAGNPKKIYSVEDLARPDVRFVNRQPGSGTRFLLDQMLRRHGVDPARVRGHEQCEYTHAAVAAYVASDMADAGFGLEAPARQFALEFIPCQTERYFLLCDERTLETPALQALRAVLAGPDFKAAVDQLPGYRPDGAGEVSTLEDSFASWRPALTARPAAASR
ncbi:substrate-binding domain-containing protein [Piscinibacter sakaiensis]|uniref:Periplasmic molybdate-binding domain n=1 Tax=Piscinibacter sakaiensis TaxID=1547922 RepID=A0A0K8P5E6_PISS1|nr:substrate-binding domain-containing protein [Piscinibacter sakaiensis]GAP37430.1 periplasmic molybdate-binding domain [Piscinibacter sakaiensis]